MLVWALLGEVPAGTGTPLLVKCVVVVAVLGPAITKLVQSNRNWQILSFSLQIFESHLPVSRLAPSGEIQWVIFSLFPRSLQARSTAIG